MRNQTIHHSLEGFFSIRKGKWKLTTKLGSGGFTKPVNDDPKEKGMTGTLYNLQEDINEKTNLYNKYPKVVAELKKLLEKIKNSSN